MASVERAADSRYRGHAFISYVREDADQADALQRRLEEAGILVWRDHDSLWAGEDWRVKIRDAITRDALAFIACFSRRSVTRVKSYQNEELALAIEQLRQRPPDVPWLIPVRFDDCAIPEYELGGGRTLASLHRADIFGGDHNEAMTRLIQSVLRILPKNPEDLPTIRSSEDGAARRATPSSTPRPTSTGKPIPRLNAKLGLGASRDIGRAQFREADDDSGSTHEKPDRVNRDNGRKIESADRIPPKKDRHTNQVAHGRSSERELEIAQKILLFSKEDGPDAMKNSIPGFADENYHWLVQAATSTGNLEATLKLIQIARQHRHVEGEACWLALAYRQHPAYTGGDIALQLADLYRRFGLDYPAMPLIAYAAISGRDVAVDDFLSWPEIVRERVASGFPKFSTAKAVLRSAAEAGSLTAARELGTDAFKAGQYQAAVIYLQKPVLIDDSHIMCMLGISLLRSGRRRAGRNWLRKAAQRGDREASLQFAASAISNQPINALASRTISEFDTMELQASGRVEAQELLLELADHCGARWLRESAIECLQRAARLGSDTAKIRLGCLYFYLDRLTEASQWLEESSWVREIPDADSRELVFQLACGLHWSGDETASERWLAAAAKAENTPAIEILAGVRTVPRMSRRRRRRILPSSARRMAGVVRGLGLERYALWIITAFTGLVGVGIMGVALWLFFSNLNGALHHTISVIDALGYELAALVLFAPGTGAVTASRWLYGIALDHTLPCVKAGDRPS